MTHISDKSVPRHRAAASQNLVSLFYECATSTAINPEAISALEQVITEIHAQGRDAIEYLHWYVLDTTGAALSALNEMILEQEIDGINLLDPIRPMIEEIWCWMTIEKNDRYS